MSTKRILIVDDDSISRELVAVVLQDAGYDVALAANGEEVVSLLASYQPHLVLTDLEMPELDGRTVLSRIRHLSPHLPIIVLTAHSEIGAQREAQRLGADDYLNKPLDLNEMLERVAQAVS